MRSAYRLFRKVPPLTELLRTTEPFLTTTTVVWLAPERTRQLRQKRTRTALARPLSEVQVQPPPRPVNVHRSTPLTPMRALPLALHTRLWTTAEMKLMNQWLADLDSTCWPITATLILTLRMGRFGLVAFCYKPYILT